MAQTSMAAPWWTRRAFMHTPERLAEVAVEARQQHGWTVEELATQAEVPAEVVVRIESGQPTRINLPQVHQVFRALQVKILALPSSLVISHDD